jgi:mycothiol synthase
MTELPAGYLLRRPRDEDAQALVDLMVAIDIDEQGSPDTEIEDLQADWSLPRFDKVRDSWTIAAPDRSFAGYGWVWDRVPHVDLQADVHVHPKHRALGLEQALLDRIEERGREHVPVAPAGEKVTVAVFAMAGTSLARILEERGYTRTRTFFRMTIDLADGYPAPTTPEGIEIRPFRSGEDDREVHATIAESFADHFRFAPEPHEEWVSRRMGHPNFDPSLWLVAWEGESMAAAILPFQFGDLSWVRELGVREAYRGRGIGKALLLASFRMFEERGSKRVSLGVDAGNATGATELYEKAGMRVEQRHELYQRPVTPGVKISSDPVNRLGRNG